MLDVAVIMERVKAVETDMSNMKEWQRSQNGSIHRVEDRVTKVDEKIDKLLFWMISAAVGLLGSFIMGLIMFTLQRK